jgi:hypothetical protein
LVVSTATGRVVSGLVGTWDHAVETLAEKIAAAKIDARKPNVVVVFGDAVFKMPITRAPWRMLSLPIDGDRLRIVTHCSRKASNPFGWHP